MLCEMRGCDSQKSANANIYKTGFTAITLLICGPKNNLFYFNPRINSSSDKFNSVNY